MVRDGATAGLHADGPRSDTAAERTAVDFAAGRLVIKTPRSRGLFGKTGTVDIVVRLPTGSPMWHHCRRGVVSRLWAVVSGGIDPRSGGIAVR
jgi:hypothetical protein